MQTGPIEPVVASVRAPVAYNLYYVQINIKIEYVNVTKGQRCGRIVRLLKKEENNIKIFRNNNNNITRRYGS